MNTDIPALPERLLFFDGHCHFCNGSVNFVQERDSKQRIFYSPLQGSTAAKMLPHLDPNHPESVVYRRNGKIYYRSSAALMVARDLDGLWPVLTALMIIPPFIRNAVYDFIAKRRYKWFGRSEACKIPNAQERKQYLP